MRKQIDFKEEIMGVKAILAKNMLPQGINKMLDLTKEHFTTYYNEVIILSGNNLRLSEKVRQGFISSEDEGVSRNQLTNRLLNICDLVIIDFDAKKEKRVDSKIDDSEEIIPEEKTSIKQEVIVKSENLIFKFRSNKFSLDKIDIECRTNEITGLVGENATGKTTLLRILSGELKHHSGTLSFPYFNAIGKNNWYKIRNSIAYVPQELPRWYGTLQDNLHYSAAQHGVLGSENIKEVEYILHRLGLFGYTDRKWDGLSGGYKLRFSIAKALVWKPKLLILDEPLANLDKKAQQIVLNDLKEFSYRNDMSIIISSQHLEEIEMIADKILYLKNGKKFFYGDRKEIGKDRNENIIEINSSASFAALENALININYISLKIIGPSFYLLTVPLEVDYNSVIQELVKTNTPFRSIDDISTSIKSFVR